MSPPVDMATRGDTTSEHIRLLAEGVPVGDMLVALDRHPELWNQRTERTASAASPHHGIDDIWCRFADPATMQDDGSHDSIWYPPADFLPVRPLAHRLMAAVGGERLGGVLITRIRAGQEVRPHIDPGWHARYYDKFAVQLSAYPDQSFHFDDGHLVTKPGDVFWFDNAFSHWVNKSAHERITLIVCIRTERKDSHAPV